MNAVFAGWGDTFPWSEAGPLKQKNQTLIIFWEQNGATLDQILGGVSDAYIQDFATATKNYGGPVIIIPLHEMNGDWNIWDGTYGSNTPKKVVLVYQHIHDVFMAMNVPNAKWGWAVNNDSVPNTPQNQIGNYYPGTDYVDYVGVDGFNFGNPWQTYSDVFSSALQQLKAYGKPIYIFSMACADGPQKSAWISDALAQIKSDPNIAGFIWFNENKEKNWLINSDSASLSAFKQGL